MLRNYLRTAFRNLRNNISYTLINMLGLSLGMAGSMLIFLFLQHHLSTDRHQPFFGRIYRIVLDMHLDEGIQSGTESSLAMAKVLATDYSQVDMVGFMRKMPGVTVSARDGSQSNRFIEKENVVLADREFMQMFAFDWLGSDASAQMSQPNAVVITEKIARKYFGVTDVAGKVLRLDHKHDLRIVGVVADQKKPTDLGFEIYISLPTLGKIDPTYENGNFGWLSGRNQTFVRLSAGAESVKIQKLLKTNGPKYYGEIDKYYEHKLQPLSDVHFNQAYGGEIRHSILWILALTGVFLIFIACINFINLATAQALKRAREIGVRKALGSSRQQLFWQFISETTLLTVGSAVVAMLLVAMLLPVMNNLVHSDRFSFGMLFRMDLLIFWLLVIPLVTMSAGFYPAVIISGFNPVKALKGRLGIQAGGIGLRRILITIQLVIAQILVIGTLVLILQLRFFQNADLGFDQNDVITIPIPKVDAGLEVKRAFRDELMQQPDISSVSYQYEAPASTMGYGGSVRFNNKLDWEKFMIRDRFGDEHYLETYRMPLLAGRNFIVRDSVTEFVVNEEFMKKAGIHDPAKILGKQLEDGNSGLKGEIVGVTKSFHLKSLQSAIEPCAIFSKPNLYKEIAIRLHTKDLPTTLKTIQKIWLRAYPDEVFSYQFVDEQIARFYEKEQQLTGLIKTFAVLAIVICALGLYGMIAFMVGQKTKEIGIRKVLGAGVESIAMFFGKEFLALTFVSFLIASPVAWYAMQVWLSDFAYRIELQWWIPASGGLFIAVITILAVGKKVMQAALMDPVKSLKTQ